MRGGGGAESHAIAVYGNMGAQVPAVGQGNTIEMRPQMGGYKFRTRTGRRHMTRRTSRRSRRSNGGTTLTEFAVPAALLFATRFGKKRGSKRGGSSRRRSNRRRSNRRR